MSFTFQWWCHTLKGIRKGAQTKSLLAKHQNVIHPYTVLWKLNSTCCVKIVLTSFEVAWVKSVICSFKYHSKWLTYFWVNFITLGFFCSSGCDLEVYQMSYTWTKLATNIGTDLKMWFICRNNNSSVNFRRALVPLDAQALIKAAHSVFQALTTPCVCIIIVLKSVMTTETITYIH